MDEETEAGQPEIPNGAEFGLEPIQGVIHSSSELLRHSKSNT